MGPLRGWGIQSPRPWSRFSLNRSERTNLEYALRFKFNASNKGAEYKVRERKSRFTSQTLTHDVDIKRL